MPTVEHVFVPNQASIRPVDSSIISIGIHFAKAKDQSERNNHEEIHFNHRNDLTSATWSVVIDLTKEREKYTYVTSYSHMSDMPVFMFFLCLVFYLFCVEQCSHFSLSNTKLFILN